MEPADVSYASQMKRQIFIFSFIAASHKISGMNLHIYTFFFWLSSILCRQLSFGGLLNVKITTHSSLSQFGLYGAGEIIGSSTTPMPLSIPFCRAYAHYTNTSLITGHSSFVAFCYHISGGLLFIYHVGFFVSYMSFPRPFTYVVSYPLFCLSMLPLSIL